MHYKEVLKKDWIYAEAFKGKDYAMTFDSVGREMLKNPQGEESECVVARFKEHKKKLVLNLTNCRVVEKLAGTGDMSKWGGLTLLYYAKPGRYFGEQGLAVRIRPKLPEQKGADNASK